MSTIKSPTVNILSDVVTYLGGLGGHAIRENRNEARSSLGSKYQDLRIPRRVEVNGARQPE